MVAEELSVLSAFLAVAEERSFTGAAKRLNVSKSGLSHAIRRLEDDVGVRLLARTTRIDDPRHQRDVRDLEAVRATKSRRSARLRR